VISQKYDLPLVLFVPDYHPAEQFWILESGHGASEMDGLVSEDVGTMWQGTVIYNCIRSVILESGNEEDTGVSPLGKELKVIVAPIHDYNAAGGKREMAGGGDVGSFAISDHGEVWQIPIVIQEQMELNGAFGLTEVSPGKQAQTKVDGGGIEAEQLVFEAKLLLFSGGFAAAEVTQMKEGVLVKLPGAVGIGIGKRALSGCGAHSQMTEFAAGDGQAVADLPQALGLSQLAKEHSDILIPGGESLGMTFSSAFIDQSQERVPGHDLEYLAEQTCGKLHGRDSFVVVLLIVLSLYYFAESLFTSQPEKPILDKSDVI